MTKRIVTLENLTLRLPAHAARDPQAIVDAVGQAVGQYQGAGIARLNVVVGPSPFSEGSQDLAARVGRATAATLKTGGGA